MSLKNMRRPAGTNHNKIQFTKWVHNGHNDIIQQSTDWMTCSPGKIREQISSLLAFCEEGPPDKSILLTEGQLWGRLVYVFSLNSLLYKQSSFLLV